MTEEKNKDLIARYYELLSSGEIDSAFDLLDDDADWVVPESLSPVPLTKAVVRDRAKAMYVNSGGTYRSWPTGMTAEGERVAVEGRTRAVLGPEREFNDKFHYLFIIRNNKIMWVGSYHDSAHVKEVMSPKTPENQ